VLVVVEGPSDEGGLGVAGGGLLRSWARIELVKKMEIAMPTTSKQTLMLTPNLPLLRRLETVSAVDRNAVLVVIAQQQVGVFARALIPDAESDVRR
jgi:hypothetical protein